MKILMVFGTRPEIIKLGMVYRELIANGFEVDVYWTGQHIEMAHGLLDLFGIQPTFHNKITGSQITYKYADIMDRITGILNLNQYNWIIVQGDTLSATAAAQAGFLNQVPVAHVEAGLRTGNMYSPWPEEYNRRIITLSSAIHFAPTEQAYQNVIGEKVGGNVHITGNTGIDALLFTREKIKENYIPIDPTIATLLTDKKLILATMHRRENIGNKIRNVLEALKELSFDNDKMIVLPVHLNPEVKKDVDTILNFAPNVFLVPPLQYTDLVYLLNKAWCVVSDSGGLQEEVPSFGIPIFITRDTTERPEVLEDFGKLVCDDKDLILKLVRECTAGSNKLLIDKNNPFGDGSASKKITKLLGDTHE